MVGVNDVINYLSVKKNQQQRKVTALWNPHISRCCTLTLLVCDWWCASGLSSKHQAITGNRIRHNFMKLIIHFLPLKARLWSGTLKTQLSENKRTHNTMDITGTTVAASHRFWVRVAGYCSWGDEAEKMKAVVSLRFLFLLWNSIYISVGTHAHTVISAETKCSLCSWYKIPLKWMEGERNSSSWILFTPVSKTRIFVCHWDRWNSYDNNQPNHHKVDLKGMKKKSNCLWKLKLCIWVEMSENKSVRKQK